MAKKRKRNLRMTREEAEAMMARAEAQARRLREYATRRPGARERLESLDK
jgi:hypothetical protein